MADRKLFSDSITPLPDQVGLAPNGLMLHAAAPQHGQEEMTVLFSLEIPKDKQADLEARVAKGEVVPFEEMQNAYGPVGADVDALEKWLKGQGFQITEVSPDRTSVYARAKVSQIEKSLAVTMVRVTKDGLTYTAAKDAPSLPDDVGKSVHAIIGLQPFRQAHKNSRKRVPMSGNRGADLTPDGESQQGPATNIANAPPFMVSEILKAYNGDGLTVKGTGQTIAILIDTFPRDSDLKKFWTRNGLTTTISQITKINVKGGALPAPEGEETLDASWTSGVAPGAKVRIYASGSLRFVDLDRALDRIIADLPTQPGLRQLSISLGLGELFMGGPSGEVAVQHQKFVRLAVAGVNVFVSSGDAGSNPDSTGHGAGATPQAEYESSDPFVVGVGGTRLELSASGTVTSETGWTGSGGGESIFFSRPAWQTGPGIAVGTKRLVPDVSAVADPDTGAFLVLHGQVTQIGGTSWSAPMWAGFCALINEARITAGKPALPFLNPLIYPLIGTSAFRDVTAGSNGVFTAATGHDMVTGIGVPNLRELIQKLTS